MSAINGGAEDVSEPNGGGLFEASSGFVSCGKKGDIESNLVALGNFRNCCIEGGSSSGGISTAKSSGGSSPVMLP